MRKKIAMRWRKACLRRGAEILEERPVFSKADLLKENIKKRENAFKIAARYKSNVYDVADDDMLKAYKLLSWCMDVEDERCTDTDRAYTIGGIWYTDTGRADWIKE